MPPEGYFKVCQISNNNAISPDELSGACVAFNLKVTQNETQLDKICGNHERNPILSQSADVNKDNYCESIVEPIKRLADAERDEQTAALSAELAIAEIACREEAQRLLWNRSSWALGIVPSWVS